MTTIPHGHGIKIFNNQTVAAGGTAESGWHGLDAFTFGNHGINGKFAGSGTLKIQYKIASIADDNYGNYVHTPLSSATSSVDSPFTIPLSLPPTYYIKFKLTETGTSNPITGLHLYFIQVK